MTDMTTTTTTTTPQNQVSASAAARTAAEAAGRSAIAAASAAENAAKSGGKTTEFKVTLISIALTALYGGLKALSVIPGPWQIPTAVVLGIAGAASSYAISRGTVKGAALAATVGSGDLALSASGLTVVTTKRSPSQNPG